MSVFITKADYYVGKRQEIIDQITDEDDTLLDEAEETAIDIVKKKLQHYDVDTIFAQVGEARDRTVKRWCIDLTLYYIYERTDDAFVPESVVKNYDDTMRQLDRISNGKEEIGLPRLEDADGVTSTKFQWGGNTPRSQF